MLSREEIDVASNLETNPAATISSRSNLFASVRESSISSWAFRLLQLVMTGAVLFYLGYKVEAIGWSAVWSELPTQPLFYLFFTLFYFAVPVSEWMAYRLIWQRPLKKHLGVFVRKKIYNFAVLSYLGEAYLAYWAKTRLRMSSRKAMASVKDGNILSSFASNSFTLLLLAIFFFTGQLEILMEADPAYQRYFALAACVGLILMPLIIYFRSSILAVPGSIMKKVVTIHMFRVASVLLLQAAMWTTVLPDVPFQMWLLLLTAQMVMTRIPFLPNSDLLFAGLGLTLSVYLDAPEAVLASMFLTVGVLAQIFNLILYVATSFEDKNSDDAFNIPDNMATANR